MENTNHNTSQDVIHSQATEMTITNILPHHTPDNEEKKQKIATQLFQIFQKYE